MKIYKEAKQESIKSWALKLTNLRDYVDLEAVDCETGDQVAVILRIFSSGKVHNCSSAKDVMETKGYDPYEHENAFDSRGCLIIIEA